MKVLVVTLAIALIFSALVDGSPAKGDESQKTRSSRVKRSPCDGLTPSLSCKAHCLAEGKGFNVGRCVAGICLCIE
ncbi:unnamed protein product [Timema podura]|uniref:Defensin n=4 Tax=Timema TaxID=61471 RepID=A0A7R9IE09_9NEOP|nr:unnamed protein product [Timema bartmani]CAD7456611.1 unnamed protein product [Timema tahoe]CAD7585620.1 unnamed protein product [Timema genevievae]CAG2053591.1 unnamed protein product [Timema podura]